MNTDHAGTVCGVCSKLGDYIEIENAQDPSDLDIAEWFPPETEHLRVPNESLERHYQYKNERLLKCFECGTFYWYRTWAPGGSEDVLRTYIHESIRRLSFLEAHVELQDAQYQAYRAAEEVGGGYWDEYGATRAGAQEEIRLLRPRCREIVLDAIHAIEHRHRNSEKLLETLQLYAPHRDHTQEIQQQREREEAIAAYHASILAEYLPDWQPGEIPAEVTDRLVTLLADSNQKIRQIIRDALLQVLGQVPTQSGLAQQIIRAAERLSPRHAEVEELLSVGWQAGEATGEGPYLG